MTTDPVAENVTLPGAVPPLKGDGSGVYRVHVIGNSGTGKSTLADELGAILGVPTIHLDRLHWNPGWVETPQDEFRMRVSARLASEDCRRGWVVDGNYNRRLNGQLDDATDIISFLHALHAKTCLCPGLDPPLLLYFPRLLKRTFLRLCKKTEQCAPGCDERISETLFSRSSILWWAIIMHLPIKRRENERFRALGIHSGGKMRRIGGWGNEFNEWKHAVRVMMKQE